MPRSFAISVALAAAVTLTTAALAGAATITYTNQAAFAAATSAISFSTVDFEGVAADGSFVFEPTPPGVTLMGANFTVDHSGGNSGFLFVIGDNFYYPGNSVLSSQQSAVVANNIVITLPQLETALSLNLGTLGAGAASWSWQLSNGDTGVLSAPAFDSLSFFRVHVDVRFQHSSPYGAREPCGERGDEHRQRLVRRGSRDRRARTRFHGPGQQRSRTRRRQTPPRSSLGRENDFAP